MSKKIYTGIDMFKFICALLIIFTHTYCFDLGTVGPFIQNNLCTIGVPFFFITSGFFFYKGLSNSIEKEEYFKKYIFRLIKMYIIFTLITLPVSIWNIHMAHPNVNLLVFFAFLIRNILFVGSLGIYWYILSLIISCTFVYLGYKYNKERIIEIISLIGFLIGILFILLGKDNNILFKLIHIIFSSERNFLNVGLFYVVIGKYMFLMKKECKNNIIVLTFLVFLGLNFICINKLGISLLHPLLAIALFVFAKQCNINISKEISMQFRQLSTFLYLFHFPFILLFDFYLRKGTLLDFSVTLVFCLILYSGFKKFIPNKLRLLIG